VAASLLAAAAVITILGVAGMRWPEGKPVPAVLALAGFAVAVNVAALRAWSQALRGSKNPIWEPTRRDAPESTGEAARASG
jgi:hypothetical protein